MVPAAGKWILGVRPDQPVTETARVALRDRLEAVRRLMPLAGGLNAASPLGEEQIEHVHQLRVATRRAAAALRLFRPALSNRRRKRLARLLGEIRRRAGEARDLDVLVEHLGRDEPGAPGHTPAALGHLRQRRARAQVPLARACRPRARRRYKRRAEGLLAHARWRGAGDEPTWEVFARAALGAAASEYFQAAGGGLETSEKLHALRIAGKRLRYTIELVADVFPAALRQELYPVFVETQDKLGAINDASAAAELFTRLRTAPAPRDQGAPREAGAAEPATGDVKAADVETAELDAVLTLWQARRESDRQKLTAAFHQWWTAARLEALRARFEELVSPAAAPR